jgi:hypothetical protein
MRQLGQVGIIFPPWDALHQEYLGGEYAILWFPHWFLCCVSRSTDINFYDDCWIFGECNFKVGESGRRESLCTVACFTTDMLPSKIQSTLYTELRRCQWLHCFLAREKISSLRFHRGSIGGQGSKFPLEKKNNYAHKMGSCYSLSTHLNIMWQWSSKQTSPKQKVELGSVCQL